MIFQGVAQMRSEYVTVNIVLPRCLRGSDGLAMTVAAEEPRPPDRETTEGEILRGAGGDAI